MWSLSSSGNSDGWSICVSPAERTRYRLVPGLEGTTPSFSSVSLSITVDEMTSTRDCLCSSVANSDPKIATDPLGMTRNLLTPRSAKIATLPSGVALAHARLADTARDQSGDSVPLDRGRTMAPTGMSCLSTCGVTSSTVGCTTDPTSSSKSRSSASITLFNSSPDFTEDDRPPNRGRCHLHCPPPSSRTPSAASFPGSETTQPGEPSVLGPLGTPFKWARKTPVG